MKKQAREPELEEIGNAAQSWIDALLAEYSKLNSEISASAATIDRLYGYLLAASGALLASQFFPHLFKDVTTQHPDWLLFAALLGTWFPAQFILNSANIVSAGYYITHVVQPRVSELVALQCERVGLEISVSASSEIPGVNPNAAMNWETFNPSFRYGTPTRQWTGYVLSFGRAVILYVPSGLSVIVYARVAPSVDLMGGLLLATTCIILVSCLVGMLSVGSVPRYSRGGQLL